MSIFVRNKTLIYGKTILGNKSNDIPIITVTPTPSFTVTPTITQTVTPTPSTTPGPVTSNLVLYYDPSNPSSYVGTGTTINDLSGNGLDGVMSNITFTSPYFTYNGTTSQISRADNSLLEPGSGDWTMEAWVYLSNTTGSKVILGKFDNGGLSQDVSYSMRVSGANIYAQFGDGSGSFVNSTGFTASINTWYQVVYVWKNESVNNIETFINGISIGNVSHSLPFLLNSTNPMYIGSYNGGEFSQYMNGRIGITRLYNVALTSSQVLQNFNADISKYISLTPTPTPTNTVTPTPTNTPTNTLTPTPTVTNTPTLTPSITPTITPTLTSTPTVTPSFTPTITPTLTSTPTVTPSITPTITNTVTPTPSSGGGIVTNNLFMKLDATNYTSGTWSDETGNGNNATINGATWLSTDGGIFDLDGINDNISVPHVSQLSLTTTGQKTVQVWVKFDALPTSGQQIPVFGKLSSASGFDGYWGGLFSNTGTVRCVTNGTSIQRVSTSTLTITTNTWYLFTFISQITSTANTTKVYINNTEYITTAHGSDTYGETNPFYLGWIGAGVSSPYLNGKIGACYFYTKGLSALEIATNYNSTKSKYGL